MTVVLAAFAATGAFLWLSSFGYLIALRVFVRKGACSPLTDPALPPVAVVVPTLNEERFIEAKIRDLAETDYPHDRLSMVVVDGGSTDNTVSLAQKGAQGSHPLRVVSLDRVPSKIDQVRQALESVSEEFVVFTDADSRLEPGCLRNLVCSLLADPRTALIGASVKPDTGLLEERIHWWFLNYLWWLEGEALAAGMFSAVCYGVRRSALLALLPRLREEKADDVRLAHLLAGQGMRVRLSRTAHATEERVPRTPGELLEFRERRGVKYVRALKSDLPGAVAPRGVKVARFMRLWHLLVSPVIAAALAVASIGLLLTGHWTYPAALAGAFGIPALAVIATSSNLGGRGWERFQLAAAGVRLVLLTWLSLMQVGRHVHMPAATKETP